MAPAKVTRTCLQCQQSFQPQSKNPKFRHCSRKCRAITQTLPIDERFRRFVEKQENGCWLWVGAKNESGYGNFVINHQMFKAHRFSWELYIGPVLDDCVLHRCDVPACVNPEHLFLGSLQDNSRDMVMKGRNPRIKLTKDQVLAIRGDLRSAHVVAAEYGVHEKTVYHIRQRRTWKFIL